MKGGAATRGVLLAVLLATFACSDPADPGPKAGAVALFPADYGASYVEVRDCRKSGDHDLDFVRVLADPAALGPYEDRTTPFEDGAVVLKEQYDFGDDRCAGPILEWTVMVKNRAATERLGWDWQRVGADRRVSESNASRCITCHAGCSGPPQVGFDSTCAEPP